MTQPIKVLTALQQWFKKNCNGTWEYKQRVFIRNVDNPGWWVKIILEDTNLVGREFQEIVIRNTELDWLECRVRSNQFEGAGGPDKLFDILLIFKNWSEMS